MAWRRSPELTYRHDGFVQITSDDELRLLLACRASVAERENVVFEEPDRLDASTQTVHGYSVASAVQQVIAAGILPAPTSDLPMVGSRVETVEVGGKPPPACRYGVGVVRALEWDCVFRSWRVDVTFDEPTGGWYGYPILGTHTFPRYVHVIGSGERPFSDMTPDEIKELYEVRRQQLWREIDPASGPRDPSGIMTPRD